jgi:hypothetical protein
MGLINLKTDLKSLRYGNDRVNGGNSGQPYITTPIPDRIGPYIGTTDFLLRGGINAVRDTAADVERLTKMFRDTKSPNGILFTAKQQLLSRTAVRTQTSSILNEGAYSPLNTLAQTGVVAFGGHLNKQGRNPSAGTGAFANNENLYDVKVTPTVVNPKTNTNRLINLLDLTSNNRNGSTKDGITLNNGINVMTYTGGPGSTLGVGSTGIRYSKTSKTFLSQPSKNSYFNNNTWVYNSTLISKPFPPSVIIPFIQQGPQPDPKGTKASPNIQDFRKILRNQIGDLKQNGRTSTESGATPLAPDYQTQNYDLRTNLGQPGQRSGKSYANYSNGVSYTGVDIPGVGAFKPGLDIINSVPIYRSENASTDSKLDDLVSFRIAVIDNNEPTFKTFLHFRAFLGGMSDSYQADWSPFKYLGRGENFYTYNGFTRTISLSWTVAAQSKQELMPMYKKLNYLASTTAPDYSPQGYMRGNIVQLTVGGYVYEQPGIITSLTYDIQDDSPWEIGIDTDGNIDNSVKQMPHIIRVSSFNFIPIQNFIPSKQSLTFSSRNTEDVNVEDPIGFANAYGNQQFISLANADGNSYPTKTIKTPERPAIGNTTANQNLVGGAPAL